MGLDEFVKNLEVAANKALRKNIQEEIETFQLLSKILISYGSIKNVYLTPIGDTEEDYETINFLITFYSSIFYSNSVVLSVKKANIKNKEAYSVTISPVHKKVAYFIHKKQKRLIEYEKTNWNPNNASKSIKELIYEATKSLFTQKFFSNLCFMRYASIYTVISSVTSADYTIIKERNNINAINANYILSFSILSDEFSANIQGALTYLNGKKSFSLIQNIPKNETEMALLTIALHESRLFNPILSMKFKLHEGKIKILEANFQE